MEQRIIIPDPRVLKVKLYHLKDQIKEKASTEQYKIARNHALEAINLCLDYKSKYLNLSKLAEKAKNNSDKNRFLRENSKLIAELDQTQEAFKEDFRQCNILDNTK